MVVVVVAGVVDVVAVAVAGVAAAVVVAVGRWRVSRREEWSDFRAAMR